MVVAAHAAAGRGAAAASQDRRRRTPTGVCRDVVGEAGMRARRPPCAASDFSIGLRRPPTFTGCSPAVKVGLLSESGRRRLRPASPIRVRRRGLCRAEVTTTTTTTTTTAADTDAVFTPTEAEVEALRLAAEADAAAAAAAAAAAEDEESKEPRIVFLKPKILPNGVVLSRFQAAALTTYGVMPVRPGTPLPEKGIVPALAATEISGQPAVPLSEVVPEKPFKPLEIVAMDIAAETKAPAAAPPPSQSQSLAVPIAALPPAYSADTIDEYFATRRVSVGWRLAQIAAATINIGVAVATINIGSALAPALLKGGSRRDEEVTTGGALTVVSTSKPDMDLELDVAAIREWIISLGPAWVKVAQSLAAREDIIGSRYAKALSSLQDNLPAFSNNEALSIVADELCGKQWFSDPRKRLSKYFSEISEEPVAAASLGQVYRAVTVDGKEVAIKVQDRVSDTQPKGEGFLNGGAIDVIVSGSLQRPKALESMALDLYIVRKALQTLQQVLGIRQDLSLIADEVGSGLFGELDYLQEAENALLFESVHKHLGFVSVARPSLQLSTQRVLVTDWMAGEGPMDLLLMARSALDASREVVDVAPMLPGGGLGLESRVGGRPDMPFDPTFRMHADAMSPGEAKRRLLTLVGMGVEASLSQLLETGVMHADPHPGNLRLTPDGKLGYIDFGLLVYIDPKHREAMFSAIVSLINRDMEKLADDLMQMDVLPSTVDKREFAKALREEFVSAGVLPQSVLGRGASAADATLIEDGGRAAGIIAAERVLQMAGEDQAVLPNYGFGQVTKALLSLALRYRFHLPPYFTLVARSLSTLEGIALSADKDFKIFAAAYPFVLRRLLTENTPARRAAIRRLLFNQEGELDVARVAGWAKVLSALYTTNEKGIDASRYAVADDATVEERELPGLVETAVRVLLSPQAVGLRSVLRQANPVQVAESLASREAMPLWAAVTAVLSVAVESRLRWTLSWLVLSARAFWSKVYLQAVHYAEAEGEVVDQERKERATAAATAAAAVDSELAAKEAAKPPLLSKRGPLRRVLWPYAAAFFKGLEPMPKLAARLGFLIFAVLAAAVGKAVLRVLLDGAAVVKDAFVEAKEVGQDWWDSKMEARRERLEREAEERQQQQQELATA